MRKIRIYFNHNPLGKANSFIKSLYSALQQTGQVEFAMDIEDDYEILFLDEFKTGVRADSLGLMNLKVRALNILYLSTGIVGMGYRTPYSINTWVWEYLKKHPELLSGE